MKRTIFLSVLGIGVSLSASVPVVFDLEPAPPEPIVQFAEATYRVGWDIDMSPYAGGEDLLFAHRCLERAEGWFISKTPLISSRSAQARFWRLSELVFAWLPCNYLATVVQHEVFGHGYRIRDISPSAHVEGYVFGTPIPYGDGGGATKYELGPKFTTSYETSVAMAGVESTAILALLTKFKWLEAHKIDPRQVAMYLLGQYDLPLYIGTIKEVTKQGDEFAVGHDMIGYVRALNLTYTANRLSTGKLRSLSWMNLADPFTYYAIYAWFHYVSTGRESSLPMIPIGKWGYLPGVRLGLTPFGPEYFFENFLRNKNIPIYFYCKAGWNAGNTYVGAGIYSAKIVTWNRWSLGTRIDLWRQPKILTQQGKTPFFDIDPKSKPDRRNPLYPPSAQHAMHLGAGVSLIAAWELSGRSGLEAELGYKTAGFVPGESLYAFPIARVYYSLFF